MIKANLLQKVKEYPFIFHFFEKCYYLFSFHHIRVLFFGTSANERYWSGRKRINQKSDIDDWGNRSSDWIKGYWNSKDHEHRQVIIDKISKYHPDSILEIGCSCGPNLYLLAKKIPDAHIVGIDINPDSVDEGNKWLKNEGIKNAIIYLAKADEISQFADNSFDIVFTDAVLIYIGPDKIDRTLQEMIRIAKKAIILVEWHDDSECNDDCRQKYHLGYWKRNYYNLLKPYSGKINLHIEKITNKIWPSKEWNDNGAIIEILIK